jgi:hypothetical protein
MLEMTHKGKSEHEIYVCDKEGVNISSEFLNFMKVVHTVLKMVSLSSNFHASDCNGTAYSILWVP